MRDVSVGTSPRGVVTSLWILHITHLLLYFPDLVFVILFLVVIFHHTINLPTILVVNWGIHLSVYLIQED